ncbi:hypothetical protein [Magnetospirillum molischianum]|uniref:Uncharacterized protein n=1 Tax=Magnetospirillum molischianum DSM 120 TaxID=1150626 RepID=H8FYA4_MAGML|nr:hypothetical protein [Magnetospirillum molischianum]CCG43342.1 hypothetical protein PHAMO_80133 [Magnetospirillum molischianum DSM 120]
MSISAAKAVAPVVTTAPSDVINDIADDLIMRHKSYEDAAQELIKKLIGSTPVNGYMRLLIEDGALARIHNAAKRKREMLGRSLPKSAMPAPAPTGSRSFSSLVKASVVTTGRKFLDEWLVEGRRLGDLTLEEVRAQAELSRSRAKGLERRAKFYFAIADLGSPTALVREVLTDEMAGKILDAL